MKFEKSFFIISFIIFFTLQLIFILFINYFFYKENKHFVKDNIKKHFEICSFKLNCKDTKFDFVKKSSNIQPLNLYETPNQFYMIFNVSTMKKFYIKLSLDKNIYYHKLEILQKNLLYKIIIEIIIIIILSLIFTIFLLYPLKKAYKINEIFLNDILHDFNTPLSTLKLNFYLLKKEIKNKRIDKMEHNIQTILNYQQNLKNLLNNNPNQKNCFEIKNLIDEKLKFYSNSYPNISYKNSCNLKLNTNQYLFESIIDNLISNAFKYNNKNGNIQIYCKENRLFIQDNGQGIKNPKKVFNRFYKENERGIGIGMNIVKKFSDELKIKIEIISKNGTLIILDLKNVL